MARYRRYIYIIGIAVLAIMGCTGDNNDSKKYARQPKDTVHTAEKAMAVFEYDPVRALEIVDSAVIVGNLPDWWADWNCSIRCFMGSKGRRATRHASLPSDCSVTTPSR